MSLDDWKSSLNGLWVQRALPIPHGDSILEAHYISGCKLQHRAKMVAVSWVRKKNVYSEKYFPWNQWDLANTNLFAKLLNSEHLNQVLIGKFYVSKPSNILNERVSNIFYNKVILMVSGNINNQMYDNFTQLSHKINPFLCFHPSPLHFTVLVLIPCMEMRN